MAFSPFQPCPAELSAAQQQVWDQRCQTAERILAHQADPAVAADPATLTYLQQYVRGEITLGQTIGRLLDHQAQGPR